MLASIVTKHAIVRRRLCDRIVNLLRHRGEILPRKMSKSIRSSSSGSAAWIFKKFCKGRMQELTINTLQRIPFLS